jgi:hypothetical protein
MTIKFCLQILNSPQFSFPVLGLLVLTVGCRSGEPADIPTVGSTGWSEQDGLETTLSFIDWAPKGEVLLRYSLRYREDYNRWVVRGTETVSIRYWDASGSQVGPVRTQMVLIGQEFAHKQEKETSTLVLVAVPRSAVSLAFELGRSGLTTPRLKLPARPREESKSK